MIYLCKMRDSYYSRMFVEARLILIATMQFSKYQYKELAVILVCFSVLCSLCDDLYALNYYKELTYGRLSLHTFGVHKIKVPGTVP